MTSAGWFRTIAIAGSSVATSLAPTYGKEHWFVFLVAGASAFALAAQSVIGKS